MKTRSPKNTLKTFFSASLLVIALVGCDDDETTTGEGYVKLYNLSEDSPSIYLTVDEDLDTDSDDDDHYESTYTGIPYGYAHSNITLTSQAYQYQLAWQDGDSTDVDDLTAIYEGDLTITDDSIHILVLSDSVLSPQVTAFNIPVIDDEDDSDYDLFNLSVLNMHPNQESIDLYISDDDETFNEAVLFEQVSYQSLSDSLKVAQGDYIFYITTAGSEEVLFTSNSIPFYYASQNIMIVKENQGSGSSPYTLDKMSDSTVIEYVDSESDAQISAYNAIASRDELPDYQEEVAIHISGVTDTPVIASLPYGELSNSLVMDSGDYSLDITTAVDNTPLLSNLLLSVLDNSNQTIFIYAEHEYVDDDNDGDIDEDNDGQIDEIEVGIYTLAIENSLSSSIYAHEVEIVNLIQSDDFAMVDVYFVKQDETIDTATSSSEVNYTKNSAVILTNNTYQVFVVAKENNTSIILNTFDLTLDEESTDQFLVLEIDENSATGYKTTLFGQNVSVE